VGQSPFAESKARDTTASFFRRFGVAPKKEMAEFEEGSRSVGNYLLGRTLGSGMSGKVKMCTHMTTGDKVALKCIDRTTLNARQFANLEREISAMRSLEHPNILRLYDFEMSAIYPRKRGGSREIVWLALELAPGGELFDFLMYTGGFEEQIAASYFNQLLGALATAHSLGISHRDIKPENILLDGDFQLKLADFGLAAIDHDQMAAGLHRTECGTRSYMAPEILAHRSYAGAKADVWSAGVVLFIMLAGNPPFQQADLTDWWFKAINAGNYERFWKAHLRNVPAFPPAAQAFLNKLFVADPDARADVPSLLAEAWLAGAAPLPAGELAKQMARRKAVVDAEKKAEAEAARKKKERERAKRAAAPRAGGGAYDAFSRRVNRAASALAPPPLLPDDYLTSHMSRYTHFYSCADADRILERVHDVCAAIAVGGDDDPAKAEAQGKAAEDAGVLKLNADEYKLRATVRALGARADADDDDEPPPAAAAAAPLTFSVQLYRMPADTPEAAEGVHVIDFMRRSGEQMDFLRLVHDRIRPQLATILDGDDEEGAEEPDAAPAAPEGSAEADLSDDIGMI